MPYICGRKARIMKRIILILSILMEVSLSVAAQRTVPGRGAPYAGVSINESSFGIRAGWQGWELWGAWSAGAVNRNYSSMTDSGATLHYSEICAEGNVMARIASARSRVISLYGGGGVFIGDEISDPYRTLPGYIDTGIARNTFIYGVQASLELEVYPLKRLGISLRGTVPLTFGSPMGWIHYEGSVNIHYDF